MPENMPSGNPRAWLLESRGREWGAGGGTALKEWWWPSSLSLELHDELKERKPSGGLPGLGPRAVGAFAPGRLAGGRATPPRSQHAGAPPSAN